MKAEKKALRMKIKELAAELDPRYCRMASHVICQKIIALGEYDYADTVFSFVGMNGEPDTRELIEDALSKGKRVGVPLCTGDGIMEVRRIFDYEADLKPGFYGILEPKSSLPLIGPQEIDFGLIPCVTCDHDGSRLGHGKGYYDRYLGTTSFPTCIICFEKLVSKEIPMEEFDKKADRVITEAE